MHRLRGRTNLLFLRMTKLIGMNSTPFRVLTNSSPSEVVKIVNWYVWSASSKGTSFLWAFIIYTKWEEEIQRDTDRQTSWKFLHWKMIPLFPASALSKHQLFFKNLSRKKPSRSCCCRLTFFPFKGITAWVKSCLQSPYGPWPSFFYIINPPTWMHQIASLKEPCRVCPPSPAATDSTTNQYPLPLGQTIVEHRIGHA